MFNGRRAVPIYLHLGNPAFEGCGSGWGYGLIAPDGLIYYPNRDPNAPSRLKEAIAYWSREEWRDQGIVFEELVEGDSGSPAVDISTEPKTIRAVLSSPGMVVFQNMHPNHPDYPDRCNVGR